MDFSTIMLIINLVTDISNELMQKKPAPNAPIMVSVEWANTTMQPEGGTYE